MGGSSRLPAVLALVGDGGAAEAAETGARVGLPGRARGSRAPVLRTVIRRDNCR